MHLLEKLEQNRNLTLEEWQALIQKQSEYQKEAAKRANILREQNFSNRIYVRGLIEFTNYCRNDCYYCGIRKSNQNADRYRLSTEQILECTDTGYELGFRTFVLQGGEDAWYTDERILELVHAIRERHPDCAITLSLGERNRDSYEAFFKAGADRYLLRHETASQSHYAMLHPPVLSLAKRKECLFQLKEIGYQTGSGFMVGSPGQTAEELAEDLLFLKDLNPQMVGIGPFIPHHDTPFAGKPPGSVELTLFLIGLLRLMLPGALLPATTALGTLDPEGREKGILAGANVVMPNLSPVGARTKYTLYDHKLCTGAESAEHLEELKKRIQRIGYRVVTSRGDFIKQTDLNPEERKSSHVSV